MAHRTSALIVGAAAAIALTVSQAAPNESVSVAETEADTAEIQEPTSDIAVTLQHIGGQTDVYRDELARMELILDPGGRLDQVHLITRTGPEADTHIWYNVDNLISVRYQFLAITGKGKVNIRTYTPPRVRAAEGGPPTEVAPLDPQDYR